MATRALVLGGGGPVGIAWETGLVAGLAERGVALAEADYILGTSAGSFVGAQLALGRSPDQLYRSQLAAAERFESSDPSSAPPPNTMALAEIFQELARGERPLRDLRKDAGQIALQSDTISEDQFVAMISALNDLPGAWPERGYACTAIDALTGELVVWDNAAGVPLNRAVTSSCAVPGVYPPITFNGRRYYDGGIGTATNSTLACGYDRVLVVAVGGGRPAQMTEAMKLMRDRAEERFAADIEDLRASGSRVEVVRPDEAAVEAFGPNVMDARRRVPAAEAGLAQGRAEGERLASFWR